MVSVDLRGVRHLNEQREHCSVVHMAGNKKKEKKDKLLVMRLIEEGQNRVNDLQETLDWTRDRVEETVEDLRDSDYVEYAQKGQEEALKLTERGREEIPALVRDVADETRDFLESVTNTFSKHLGNMLPDIDIDVTVNKEDDD